MTNRTLRALAWAFIALALLAFVGYFAIYTHFAYRLFLFPFDYDQGEGFELLDTVLFSQGEWPYRNSDVYPFYASNYPPVYHLVIVPLVWLFGPQYWTGRLVSYIGTLITAWAIGYAVFREQQQRRWWLVALAGLSYLASNYVYHVGPLFRQHLFMVMFEVLAVVAMTAVIDKEERTGVKNWRGILLVLTFLLLAGYTKQLAYATVVAVFLFFFLRQVKRSILWAIPFAAVTGLVFLWLNVATEGQWFMNTISANLNEFYREQAIGLYKQWFRLHIVLTIVSGLYALYQLYFERLSLYTIWFVVTVANSVTAGTWGAGESYFVTAVAASCIITALAFSRLLDWLEWQEWQWQRTYNLPATTILLLIIPILYLIQADRVFHMPTHTPLLKTIATTLGKPTETVYTPRTACSAPVDPKPIPYVDDAFVLIGRPPTPEDTAAGIEIANEILLGETPAFSEEAGFNFYVGREIVTNPTQLRNLDLAGVLDQTEMLQMLNDQAFDTIIFRAQLYPWPVLEAIGQQYETTRLIEMNGFVYCILRPADQTE